MGIRTSPWKRESSGSHKVITRRGVYRTGESGTLVIPAPDKLASERVEPGPKVDPCPKFIRVVHPTNVAISRLVLNPYWVERERRREAARQARLNKGMGETLLSFA